MNRSNQTFIEINRLTVVIIVQEPDLVDVCRGQDLWQFDISERLVGLARSTLNLGLGSKKTLDSRHPALLSQLLISLRILLEGNRAHLFGKSICCGNDQREPFSTLLPFFPVPDPPLSSDPQHPTLIL
jgi:hypothetical protein